MVDIFDPVQNKSLSYHIDKALIAKWDKIKDGQLIKKDEDRVYIVDGRERVGKSLFTFQQAKYLDPTFNVDRICFTPEEFLEQIRKAPEGSVIVFDEAFRGLSSKASQSKINKRIVQAMMEMGQRNLIAFIVLPTFFLLELYPAVLRSNALFHLFKDKKGRRTYKIYNEQRKSKLYEVGRKNGFSYARPKVIKRYHFYNNREVIDWRTYEEKKLKSLKDTGLDTEKDKTQEAREEYYEKIKKLKELLGGSDTKVSKLLKENGIALGRQWINKVTNRELIGKDKLVASPL